MAENKIKFGLQNVHYALLTETDGTATYATPVRMPGAVNLSLEASGDTSTFYADNMAYYVTAANDGYSGTLEVALVPESFYTDVLGEQLDATDKVSVEVASAEGKPFALLFEFAGDTTNTRHVLYNCTATRPSLTGKTNTNTKEPNTDTLNIKASPLANGHVKAKTSAQTESAVVSAWYNAVWQMGADA